MFCFLELDIQSFFCIPARKDSEIILRHIFWVQKEVLVDITEVVPAMQYQCVSILNTSGIPWASVNYKEVSSPRKGIFSVFLIP